MRKILSQMNKEWLMIALTFIIVASGSSAIVSFADIMENSNEAMAISSVSQSATPMSASQLVELLVSLGTIPADKVADARTLANGSNGTLDVNDDVIKQLTSAKGSLLSIYNRLSYGYNYGQNVRSESMLNGQVVVQLKTTNTPVFLPKGGNTNLGNLITLQKVTATSSQNVYVNSHTQSLISVSYGAVASTDGWTIPANKIVNLTFSFDVKANSLFAGQYRFNMYSSSSAMYTYYKGVQNIVANISIPKPITSNILTVVGEKSPYISAAMSTSDDTIAVEGVRLYNGQTVTVVNMTSGSVFTPPTIGFGLSADSSGKFGTVYLGKSFLAQSGRYTLQLTDPKYGASNVVYFEGSSGPGSTDLIPTDKLTAILSSLGMSQSQINSVIGTSTNGISTDKLVSILKALGLSQVQIDAVIKSLGVTTPCGAVFTRDLTVGSSGSDVTALQQLLGQTSVTGYFGPVTKSLVINYQNSKGISPADGFVGLVTRNALNSCGTTVVTPVIPILNSITINSTNTEVTVTGKNISDITGGSLFCNNGQYAAGFTVGDGTTAFNWLDTNKTSFTFRPSVTVPAGTCSFSAKGLNWPQIQPLSLVVPQITTATSTQPLIISVEIPNSTQNKMIVRGTNLMGTIVQVYIDNTLVPGVDGSKDGSSLFFIPPNLSSGQHSIYVKTDSGVSQTFTFSLLSLLRTSLNVGLSSASRTTQLVLGGTTSDLATWNFMSTTSPLTITDLHFRVEGNYDNMITGITVAGKNFTVINNSASTTGINIPVSVGYAGVNVPVSVTYNTVGLGGVQTNGSVKLVLDGAAYKASESSYPTWINFNSPSNSMILVASKPTLMLNPSANASLNNGDNELARITVNADSMGSISISSIPLYVNKSIASVSNYMAYENGSVISDATVSDAGISFSTPLQISAGSSRTISIRGIVSNVQTDASVSVSLGSSNSLIWVDVEGGNMMIAGVTSYNYPTNSVTLRK